jgi:hypothetical protein
MHKHATIILPIILASVISAGAADSKKITYQDHVRPLFENRCFNCHNPDKAKGGLDLTTFTNTMAGGSSGEIITPGASSDSRLYKSVAHLEDPAMPPKGDKMPKAELDLIAKWIDTGVLETSSSSARKTKKPAFDLTVQDTGSGKPEGPPPMPEHLLLDPPIVTYRPSAQADIASSPWAPLIAITGQKQVLLYNTDNHQLAGVLPFPEGFPEHLSFSRNGSLLLAAGGRGGKSGRVVIWDVKTGKRAIEVGNEFDTVLAADITSDHTLVALGGPSRRIKIFNTSDGSELISIKKHTDWITTISFSPDGVLLATGDRNGGLFVWEAATGNPFYTLKAHSKAITSITWRADSNIVGSASEDGSIRLWEMKEGKQVKNWTGHGSGVTDLEFTHDGHLVSVGRDKHAKIWDQNGTAKKDVTGFGDIPLAASFSHDGKKFITGDWLGNVHVWDSATGNSIANLAAAPPAIATRLADLQKQLEAHQPLVADLSKKHNDFAGAIPPVKIRGTEAQKQINAFSGQRKAADAELQGARKAIADATAGRDKADATNKPKFEEQLEQANGALGAAAGKIGQLDKQLAEANNALKAHQAEFKVAQEKANKAEAELSTANDKLASLTRQNKFWQAAQINTQRLSKSDEVAQLQGELAFIKEDQASADQVTAAVQAKVTAAEESAALAPAATAAKQKLLEEAKTTIPAIDNKLSLTAVVVENKRLALENLNKIEPKTAEHPPVLAAATKEHEDAIARQKAEQAELATAQKVIQAADAEWKKAQAAQAAAPEAIQVVKVVLADAQAKRAQVTQLVEAKASQVSQAEAQTKTLWAKYQAALPK